VESRIHGDMYVRFGGEHMETYYSNIERRWVLSLRFKKAGYPAPRTGWSPALFPKDKLVKEPFPACVFGLYFPSLKRIAHVGFVERIRGKYCVTIEGNTNPEGSREGGGVFRRMRYRKTISKYANWL